MTRTSLDRRALIAGSAGLVAGGVVASRFALAQTPDASPDASPAASPIAGFPEGPLGIALTWLQDALNTPGGPSAEDVTVAVSPESLADSPAAEIASLIASFADAGGPWTIDTTTMIMTMDFPPTNASFFAEEPGGLKLKGGLSIDRNSDLIGNISLELIDATATLGASPTG